MKTTMYLLVICLVAMANCSTTESDTTQTDTIEPEMISFEDCLTVLQVQQGADSPLEACLESDRDFNDTDRRGDCEQCGEELAQAYLTCEDTARAHEILSVCTSNSNGDYCVDLITNINIDDQNYGDTAVDSSCEEATSCSESQECRQSLENLIGCCIADVPDNNEAIAGLKLNFRLSDCNFEACQPPFILNNTVPPPTLSPAMICYNEDFEENPLLETCHMLLFNATTMPDQYSAESFCNSTCATSLAETYDCCEETDGLPWLYLGVPSAVVIQNSCQLTTEPEERYCLDLYFNTQSDYEGLINNAAATCSDTNCTDDNCISAIQALTCCAHAVAENGLIASELVLSLLNSSECNVTECTGGFNLPCSEPTTAPPTMPPTTVAATMMTTTDSGATTINVSLLMKMLFLLVSLAVVHRLTQ